MKNFAYGQRFHKSMKHLLNRPQIPEKKNISNVIKMKKKSELNYSKLTKNHQIYYRKMSEHI